MRRKLFAIGIAAALALSTGVVVFADSSEKTIGGNESQSLNVIAKRKQCGLQCGYEMG